MALADTVDVLPVLDEATAARLRPPCEVKVGPAADPARARRCHQPAAWIARMLCAAGCDLAAALICDRHALLVASTWLPVLGAAVTCDDGHPITSVTWERL